MLGRKQHDANHTEYVFYSVSLVLRLSGYNGESGHLYGAKLRLLLLQWQREVQYPLHTDILMWRNTRIVHGQW